MPLVLDLLRHGDALPATEGGDEERRLSPRGRAELERLATHLAGVGWRPERAFTSPLVRARDSATIALSRAAPDLRPEVLVALRPECNAEVVVAALEPAVEVGGAEHVLLVGHQPQLGLLAGLLTGGPAPAFAPGSLVRIEFAGTLAAGAGVPSLRLAPGFAGLNAKEAQ